MSSSWRDRLASLKRVFGRSSKESSVPPNSSTPIIVDSAHLSSAPGEAVTPQVRRPTDAHLGIDFGTRFTKVVLRIPRLDRSAALKLGPEARSLFPSRLAIRGDQVYPPDLVSPDDAAWVEFLKMRLTSAGDEAFATPQLSHQEIAALNACFLAGVLRLAKASSAEAGLLVRDADVRWFAQVGVPVMTFDSPDLSRFEDVCAVAWVWQDETPRARSLSDLVQSYQAALATRPCPEDSPIQVAPELSAAIFHIALRPDAPEGLYAFVDIGGGTLDATVFALQRGPTPMVTIRSALVKPLGTIPVATQISGGEALEEAERRLIAGPMTSADRQRLSQMERPVQLVIHEVIAKAVQSLSSLNFVSVGQSDLDARMRTNRYHTVPVMLAGGGAGSSWYRNAFVSLDMRQRTIGEFKVRTVDRPPGILDDDYERFVVARGLSHGELKLRIDCHLPSQIARPEPPPAWQIPTNAPVSKEAV